MYTVRKRRTDLGNEGGFLGGDLRLCGAVMNFLSELSGRGFRLDDGGGCFVAATWEMSTSDSSKETIKSMHLDICERIDAEA